MLKHLIVGALISFSCSPALANGSTVSSSSNAQNNQNNSGTVNLAPMGGSNSNYQINSVSNSQYQFGPGISCPTPELAIGTYGGADRSYDSSYSNGANSLGATIMFTTPLGGEIGRQCKELVKEITKQRQLDTKVAMIQQCAKFAREGVQLDPIQFPEFAVCSAVTVNGQSAVNP